MNNKAVTFIFDEELINQLGQAAQRMMTTKSEIVRRSTRLFLRYHDEAEHQQYENMSLAKGGRQDSLG